MSAGFATLLWSSSEVLWVDPAGQRKTAPSLREFSLQTEIKSVVVLIAHRNSLIRTTKIPSLPRSQLDPIIRAKANSLFPQGAQGYSLGYRIAGDSSSGSKSAIVGGTRSDNLRRIYSDADACGLRVLAVLPAAFSSWIAAKEAGLSSAIVISQEGPETCFDVIADGELLYSRFAQLMGPGEIGPETNTTLHTAGLTEAPILTLGELEISHARRDSRDPSAIVRDLPSIHRSLFSLELPELSAQREKKRTATAMQRAITLATVAILGWGFVGLEHRQALDAIAAKRRINFALDAGESSRRAEMKIEENVLLTKKKLLDLAFDPPQTFSDVVTVLAQDSDKKLWLSGLSMERGGEISIRGQALDQKTISKFVLKLRSEPRFRDVELHFITKGQWNNQSIYQFWISAWGVGNLPFDQWVEARK